MEPYLRAGDKVLVWQWVEPQVGEVVVFKVGKEFWVKRVKDVKDGRLKVEGDNKKDSLEVGEIKREQIMGVVVKLHFG